MLHCANEQEGFNTFYKLLDEFQNQNKNVGRDLSEAKASEGDKYNLEEVIGRKNINV